MFEREIRERLGSAGKIAVMAVGDELNPRDCLGILAGKKIAALKLRRMKVLLTYQMPENYTSVIRKLKPSHVVIIDATDMGGEPGAVAFIDPDRVSATSVSSHAMPLTLLMDYLEKELGTNVSLIGIQPAELADLASGAQPKAVLEGIDRIAKGFEAALAGPARKKIKSDT